MHKCVGLCCIEGMSAVVQDTPAHAVAEFSTNQTDCAPTDVVAP
jgi:hypothetical protein